MSYELLPIVTRKHMLCKQANTDLAFVSNRIASIRRIMQTCHFEFMGWLPIDEQGNLVPPLDHHQPEDQIQWRVDDMTRRVASLTCYIGLHKEETQENIPEVGLTGRAWLKEFLVDFRRVRHEYTNLCMDTIYHTMVLVFIVGVDTANNTAFNTLYGKTFSVAMVILRDALPPTDDMEARAEFCKYLMRVRVKEYKTLDYMQRLLPGAASLSVASLVQHVAELFRLNLLRWDRTHGLALPQVRRVLETLAFEMEPMFDRGVYDLTSLFNKL